MTTTDRATHRALHAFNARLVKIESNVYALNPALAQTLGRNLDVARDRDLTLARDLASASASDRDLTLDLARDLTSALAFARGLASDLDLDRARDRDRDLARDLARGLASDLDRALVRDLDRDLDRGLARDLTHALGLDHARDRARVLAVAVSHARSRVQTALETMATGAEISEPRRNALPARSALQVLHRTLRVLPMTDRARYREELEAELAELATAGACRPAQLGYALRLAGRMWALRRALRAPAPGRTQERIR